mmetsp:Transcript_85255/g.206681  ORF Transcript_85255/g.206681 Transcript_85255/m.206681 type:complete len:269 (-) Transcript_85255:765-1571(-)
MSVARNCTQPLCRAGYDGAALYGDLQVEARCRNLHQPRRPPASPHLLHALAALALEVHAVGGDVSGLGSRHRDPEGPPDQARVPVLVLEGHAPHGRPRRPAGVVHELRVRALTPDLAAAVHGAHQDVRGAVGGAAAAPRGVGVGVGVVGVVGRVGVRGGLRSTRGRRGQDWEAVAGAVDAHDVTSHICGAEVGGAWGWAGSPHEDAHLARLAIRELQRARRHCGNQTVPRQWLHVAMSTRRGGKVNMIFKLLVRGDCSPETDMAIETP